MAKKHQIPVKKTTKELFEAIDDSLAKKHYYFTWHGEYRSKLRKRVNDLEVLTILKSKGRRHEARKDKLEINRTEVRISLSFDCDFSVIITVINLDEES